MSRAGRLFYRIELLTSLSALVVGGLFNHVTGAISNGFKNIFNTITPSIRTDSGVLVNTYELMRARLRAALDEIEQKNRQLQEYSTQLKGSVDFLQNIIDGLDEELMVMNKQLRIIHANRITSQKGKNEGVVGRNCYEAIREGSRNCQYSPTKCPAEKVWQTGIPYRTIQTHTNGNNSGNSEIYLEINALPIRDRAGKITHVMELTKDISEEKRLEKQITEANNFLLTLNAIASTISQSLSIDVILNSALDKILELTKADAGGVLLLDEKSQILTYRVHRGLSDQFVKGTSGLAVGEGIAGRAVKQHETLVVENISTDTRVTRPEVSEEGLIAFVSVPLLSKEKVIGVLNIANRRQRPFSEQEIHLLNAIGNQLGIALENARLYQELQIKDQIRADLLRQIILTQEDERRRVARELHDVTSQALATLATRLESLGTTLSPNKKEAEHKMEAMRELLSATSKEVHRLIYDLRPSQLDDLGLPSALRTCAYDCLKLAGIEVHMEIVGQETRLPPEVEITIFRIAQEAIANIAHHAKAESAFISLEFKNNSAVIQVEDDGIGFDLSQKLNSDEPERHMGLLGMKERADLIGGTLVIETKPSSGTRIAAEIPIEVNKQNGKDKTLNSG